MDFKHRPREAIHEIDGRGADLYTSAPAGHPGVRTADTSAGEVPVGLEAALAGVFLDGVPRDSGYGIPAPPE